LTRFIERFVTSFDEPPREVTLDIDVFDDPTHVVPQRTFFHGHYKPYHIWFASSPAPRKMPWYRLCCCTTTPMWPWGSGATGKSWRSCRDRRFELLQGIGEVPLAIPSRHCSLVTSGGYDFRVSFDIVRTLLQ
jgi:hypothetical protein